MDFFIKNASLMSTQNRNVISGVAGVEIDDQVLSVFLDKFINLFEESSAGCDVSANASYICF